MAERDGRDMRRALPFLLVFLAIPLPSQAYSRIVSLKPNITEILFAIGVGPQLAAVTKFCDRPEEAKKLPKVADYIHVNTEELLRLGPDLVIGSTENSSQKEIDFLRERGIQVNLFPFSTIAETLSSIEAIGALVGKPAEAQGITRKMREDLSALQRGSSPLKKKRVLFVVGANPLVVAGGNNFFDEAAPYLGAINVAGESRLRYPTYTTERLIRSSPEVILELTMGTEKSAAGREERLRWWGQYRSLPAVARGQIYFLDIERMRAVPSLPDFLREIFTLLHGPASPPLFI